MQLECVTCRYGVSVLVAPERCPMCGGAAWEPELRAHLFEGADLASVVPLADPVQAEVRALLQV